MLVAPAAKGVVNDVHGDTPDTRPVGRGIFHLVELVSCRYKRLLNPSAAGNNTNRRTAPCVEPFRLAAGHPDANAPFGLVDHDCLNTRGPDKLAAIIRAGLDVADV
jgi:hypothetical protein